MNQAKAHEILDNRLAQAHSLLTAFIAAGGRPNEDLSCQTLSNALWAVQELIEQAQKALPHIGCHGAPDETGTEREARLLMGECRDEIRGVLVNLETYLDNHGGEPA